MPIALLPLLATVLALDYLRRQLLPAASSTTPVGEPYDPPFTGGQCSGAKYNFYVDYKQGNQFATDFRQDITGSIGDSIFTYNDGFSDNWKIPTGQGDILYRSSIKPVVRDVVKTDQSDDDCGDLPNPVPPPPISSDGLANVSAPNMVDDNQLVQGSPIVAVPSIGAALSAIAALVAAASNALDAIKKVMDAIEAIGDVLDKIKDWLDDKDKNDRTKKSLYRHDYGSIRKDGFLRLFPSGEADGFEPSYLDLQLLSIPIGYGKFFGSLSPNFYRFASLGHISFVSPSFGIIETHEIEFSRVSINVPANAYGFFYHLGLNDIIRANVSLFYLRFEEEEEE